MKKSIQADNNENNLFSLITSRLGKLLVLLLLGSFTLVGCQKQPTQQRQQKPTPVKIDRVVVRVKYGHGITRKWKTTDENFIKTLDSNVNVLIGKKDHEFKQFNGPLPNNEKDYVYYVSMFSGDKPVKEITLKEENKLTINGDVYHVSKDKQKQLASFKSHLLLATE